MCRWICLVLAMACCARAEPPTEWVESQTGHRVVRLSREAGTSSLYFHQNPFTANGDKCLVTTSRGLATIDLNTRAVEPLTESRGSHIVVGRRTRQVFYVRDGAVYATHLDTKATREIAKFSSEQRRGSGFGVNADETMLVGSMVVGAPQAAAPERRNAARRGSGLEQRWAMHLPMALYTIEITNGSVKQIYHTNEWINHVQCSPTDPGLIMFCHEGPWHKVDRIWTIRTNGHGIKRIHSRRMEMEIAGHEFFSPDGKVIWYDLQTPKGKEFWLEGYQVGGGERITYAVRREHWSVHYNVAPDGKTFAGDGGGPRSVAAPGNGQWIYLFTPRDGKLEAEKLVDLSKHDYELEPNVMFTPDGKWVIFRSNMHGATHVYAVEVRRTRSASG